MTICSDIVYVDDTPESFLALASSEQRARIREFAFDEGIVDAGAFSAAAAAEVWLFDFFLVDSATEKYRDENGLSLFQKWKSTNAHCPTTVVVSSDVEGAIGEPVGPVERRHVIAQRHGVEWIGGKTKEMLVQVIDLADASRQILRGLEIFTESDGRSSSYNSEKFCFDGLGLPKEVGWANSAQRQIDRARPPREVAASGGSAAARPIIGWLLSHVLPYPSFLLTDAQAGLRLGIAPRAFRLLADENSSRSGLAYGDMFRSCEYRGPLSRFLGRRWWRAGIDDMAWHLSEADGGLVPALEAFASGARLDWLTQKVPVLLSNHDLVETDEVAEASQCVRVSDEDFPANVDPAWVLQAEALSDRKLSSKVVFEDRELLKPTDAN